MGVDDIFDLMNMDEKEREKLLKPLTPSQLKDVAKASNRYPVVNVEFQVSKKDDVLPNENLQCTVTLERDCAEETSGAVYAPYFPREKEEQWWLVVGRASSNSLAAIKRLSLNKPTTTVTLSFEAPETDGKHSYVLYLMGDSYVGGDQEYKFDVRVRS
ncbi:putative activating signal cointegrator 1 complex subunit 3 family 1 ASCC3L1, partial [Toxoplasma gondii p89]